MRMRSTLITRCKFFSTENDGTQALGRVTDLIVEEQHWKVRYLVVVTNGPNPRNVLIVPSVISNIDTELHKIHASLTLQQFERSPQLASDAASKGVKVSNETGLRSAAEICNYAIHSRNGPAGRMEDLVINLAEWTVDYVTADSQSWLASECSMFSTTRITEVDRSSRRVKVDLRQEILQSFNNAAVMSGESTPIETARSV